MIGPLLGHTQIGTTPRYAHLIDSPLRAKINAVGEMLKPRLRVPAFPNSCLRWGGSKCHAFDLCLKQDNLTDVEKADVMVAPYDT